MCRFISMDTYFFTDRSWTFTILCFITCLLTVAFVFYFHLKFPCAVCDDGVQCWWLESSAFIWFDSFCHYHSFDRSPSHSLSLSITRTRKSVNINTNNVIFNFSPEYITSSQYFHLTANAIVIERGFSSQRFDGGMIFTFHFRREISALTFIQIGLGENAIQLNEISEKRMAWWFHRYRWDVKFKYGNVNISAIFWKSINVNSNRNMLIAVNSPFH